MAKAIWNGAVVAESNSCKVVDGELYFPPESVRIEFLRHSDTHTICSWKGEASYYHLDVNGEIARDAGWYYPAPKPTAIDIQGYIAFWNGVRIE